MKYLKTEFLLLFFRYSKNKYLKYNSLFECESNKKFSKFFQNFILIAITKTYLAGMRKENVLRRRIGEWINTSSIRVLNYKNL